MNPYPQHVIFIFLLHQYFYNRIFFITQIVENVNILPCVEFLIGDF